MAHNIFTFIQQINCFCILVDGISMHAGCSMKGCSSNQKKREITDQTDTEEIHVQNNQVCTPNEVKMEVSFFVISFIIVNEIFNVCIGL